MTERTATGRGGPMTDRRKKRISAGIRRAWADPQKHEAWVKALREANARPDVRKKKSEGRSRYLATQAGVAQMQAIMADPKVKARKSRGLRRAWKKNREAWKASIKQAASAPEHRKKDSEANRRAWENPARRALGKKVMLELWANPQYKSRTVRSMRRAAALPENRRKKSEATKQLWRDRKVKLASAWRPTDWGKKPIEWRIIGTELLLKADYMSNIELASRLDNSRIIECPYGETWRSAINRKECSMFIRRIRRWVLRPGKTAQKPAA